MFLYARGRAFWLAFMFCLVGVLAVITPQMALGQISSCSATVDPHVGDITQSFNLDFEVTNEDVNSVAYLKIARPTPDVVIESVSVDNWSVSGAEDYVELVGSTLGGGEILTFTFTVSIQGGVDVNGNWVVSVSEGSSGLEPTTCSGDLPLTASAALVPPSISNIHLTNLSTDQATVNWDTDEGATSQVYYGKTGGYGSSSTNQTSLTLGHAATITNLTPNTAYHYQVRSVDADSNETLSGDNTFLTPNGNVSTSPTAPSLTNLVGLKAVPTEKVPPTVALLTDISKPQKTVPTISGTAEDNEAVAGVLYSLDGGKNWLPVDAALGLGSKKVTFSFTPINLKDGDYSLLAQAVDTSSNKASTAAQTLIIDRLPPLVGGNIMSLGPQVLAPDHNGTISSLVGIDQKITLSAVGGPTNIALEATTAGKVQVFSLTKSSDTGLWSGVLSFAKTGVYTLTAKGLDGADNTTSRALNNVIVLSSSHTFDAATKKPVRSAVTLYYFEPESETWAVWDGASFGQSNPQTSDEHGNFELFLPSGKYYLKAEAKGYETLISSIFETDKSRPLTTDLMLKPRGGISLGSLHLSLPTFAVQKISIKDNSTKSTSQKSAQASLIGQPAPVFSLVDTDGNNVQAASLFGHPTVISFGATWSPTTVEQLPELAKLQVNKEINIIPVALQENAAKVKAYVSISGLKLRMVVDPDSTLTTSYMVQTLPTHYFINRKGIVTSVVVGVMNSKQILDTLSSL